MPQLRGEFKITLMLNYLNTLRMFSRDARLYLVTAALIGLTVFGGIYPALLNLYLRRLGYELEFIGLVNGLGLLGIALFSLPVGILGERWGPRRMMIAGLSLSVVGYGATALTELISPAWQRGWLLGMYSLTGLGIAMYIVNSNPFLMGVTNPAERQHVFSVQAALMPLLNYAANIFFNVYLDDGLQVPTVWIGSLAAVGRLVAVPAAPLRHLAQARIGNRSPGAVLPDFCRFFGLERPIFEWDRGISSFTSSSVGNGLQDSL